METIRENVIKKANDKLAGHIIDFLKQFEKLERTGDGKLIGWCCNVPYILHINVAITTNLEKVDINTIV